jgi:hypothetical protein
LWDLKFDQLLDMRMHILNWLGSISPRFKTLLAPHRRRIFEICATDAAEALASISRLDAVFATSSVADHEEHQSEKRHSIEAARRIARRKTLARVVSSAMYFIVSLAIYTENRDAPGIMLVTPQTDEQHDAMLSLLADWADCNGFDLMLRALTAVNEERVAAEAAAEREYQSKQQHLSAAETAAAAETNVRPPNAATERAHIGDAIAMRGMTNFFVCALRSEISVGADMIKRRRDLRLTEGEVLKALSAEGKEPPPFPVLRRCLGTGGENSRMFHSLCTATKSYPLWTADESKPPAYPEFAGTLTTLLAQRKRVDTFLGDLNKAGELLIRRAFADAASAAPAASA